jgi:hypothetical protein
MHKRFALLLLPLFLLATACKNLYVQKSVFVPILKEKGDLRVDANLGKQNFGINTAYAFHDHFSIMVNGFGTIENNEGKQRKYNRQLEFGIGTQKVFKDSFHFESFIGGSQGWFQTDFDRATGSLKVLNVAPIYGFLYYLAFPFFSIPEFERVNASGNYQTVFFQNSLTAQSRHTSSTFTARLLMVRYKRYIEEGVFNGQSYGYRIGIPQKVFFQPVITNKFGADHYFKLTTQFGYNIELNKKETLDAFEWNKFFFSIGLEFGIQTHRKKRTKRFR